MSRLKLAVATAALAMITGITGAATPAAAQDSVVEGAGYKVGEGTVVHPSIGMETAVISNVFFEESSPVVAPVLRLIGNLAIASLSPQRSDNELTDEGEPVAAAPKVKFRAGLELGYIEYMTGNERARAQRDLSVGAIVDATVFPESSVAFGTSNHFVRDTRPTNFESNDSTNRDINHLKLRMLYQPGGRALVGALRYENRIDIFEDADQRFANRIQHTLGGRVDWQFLPITRFHLDASIGLFGPLGDSSLGGTAYKQSSMPLRILAGAKTAITERITLNGQVGFGKGFYSGAEFMGAIGGLEAGFRYSPVGRLLVSYNHDFTDSVNANFFSEHVFKAGIDQQIDVILLRAGIATHLRSYQGIPMQIGAATRTDFLLIADAEARYMYRDWLAFVGDYQTVVDATSYTYTQDGDTDDPSYTRHQVTVGVRAAF